MRLLGEDLVIKTWRIR